MGKRRHPVQREKDLEDIAYRYLALHEPQAVIAAALNVSQQTVSNDIKLLVKRWRESALVDVDNAKAEELARINRLELEYWEAWKRSQRDKEAELTETQVGDKSYTKAQERKEGQTGDPRFLAGVQWCIERRCKILGIDAPTKIAPTDPSGTKEYADLTDEERITKLAEIFDAARTRAGEQATGVDVEGSDVA